MTLSIVTYCVILRNDKLQKDTTQVNYVSFGTDVAFPVRCQKYVFVCEETSTLLSFCELSSGLHETERTRVLNLTRQKSWLSSN